MSSSPAPAPRAEHLTKQFRKHTVDRRYLALTRGVPAPGGSSRCWCATAATAGAAAPARPTPPDGKRAVTHVKVLETFGAFALVECRLETGRTHQVRIHLGEAGTPLCGEAVYDRPVNGKPLPDGSGAKRPMLHAARLGFVHPESGDGDELGRRRRRTDFADAGGSAKQAGKRPTGQAQMGLS